MFPGLSYNKANNTFLNNLRKNDVDAQVEKKLWKVLGSPVIDETVKKDSLLVKYVLKFFEIMVGWCGSIVVRERD